jgi:hypothetical protein
MTQQEIKYKIGSLEAKVKNPSLPESAKNALNKMIADLKSQIKEEDEPAQKKTDGAKPAKKEKPAKKAKAEKKADKAPAKKAEPEGEEDNDAYCRRLIAEARQRKAKAKEAAAKRAAAPKKTPATKNKEAVEKTTARVTGNVEKRAKKEDVNPAEIEKLIAEYEVAIKKLKTILASLKSGKKMATGGSVDEIDGHYSALKQGERVSRKYAVIETRGGGAFHRRNANQFGKSKGGKKYSEGRENRVDKKKYL